VILFDTMKNIKTRYYLEPKAKKIENRTKPELVMAEINYGYATITQKGQKRHKPTRFSLQVTILPNSFGKSETNYKFDEEVFKKATRNNVTVKNRMLNFETALNEIASNHIIAGTIPTPKELNDSLTERLRSEVVRTPKEGLLSYLCRKIEKEKSDSGKSMKTSKGKNTIKTYESLSHLIENYELATNTKLMFEALDSVKYWHIWDTLDDILKGVIQVKNPNQTKKQRKQYYGYLVSSIRKYQKALMTTLRDANKDGFKMLLDFNAKDLILNDVEASKDFYVEVDELKKVISSDVAFNPDLQSAKDYLIVACLTGLRYESMEELHDLKIEQYKDDKYGFKYIHSKHNKTKTEVCIPLLKPVLDIIGESGRLPRAIGNAPTNKNLKELFKHLGINRSVKQTKVTYRSGTIESIVPISTLISTHDCKGTFYSNLYQLGVSETLIDNITHPDRKPKNAMARVYNKTTMLAKAKMFVDEVKKVQSEIYTF
jgi:integrase